jgi:hypothetical protein
LVPESCSAGNAMHWLAMLLLTSLSGFQVAMLLMMTSYF